jgi:Ti-type conjugative transfer relaxase TraA
MAIYHLAMKPVSRSTGRSSVAAAAYRSGTRLTNERDGLVHDYTHKGEIEHSEIVLPEGVAAEWALDRERLWNAAEFAEKRKDARVAWEFEVALPHELTRDERIELTRSFAQSLANRFGGAVDFSLHAPDDDMDVRNHHAHILMTTRVVGEEGLGDKTSLERENAWLKANDLPTTDMQLKALRLEWEEMTNLALARAGHDVRVDHRSHQDRGLSIEPTSHVGVHAHQMEQRGEQVERQRLEAEARARNAALIREDPNQVLQILSSEKSVFDKRDIARTLHRYINDDPAEFQGLLDRVMASEELVKLSDGRDDREGPSSASASPRYSTREMLDIETGMARAAADMADTPSHRVGDYHVVAAIQRQDDAIQRSVNIDLVQAVERGEISQSEAKRKWKVVGLSSEQVGAIEHITGDEQISVVVGYAGAGKSTMLAAAREAWEAQGYSVHGAALAGKAAEGLEESSGISSRTLASWDMRLRKGTASFSTKDVLVIDEAGMVGSRQLSRFIEVAHQSGAKVVLVGDHEQLQAIGAGAAFRSVAEEVGFVSLEEVRRQRSDWQKEASVAFASQRTDDALEAYAARGHIHLEDDAAAARAAIVRDYVADMDDQPDGTRIAMAHRRADVHALNLDIRRALQEKGDLPGFNEASLERATADVDGGRLTPSATDAVEVAYATDNGVRTFAAGDRIVFLQNDKELNVRNGMLGSVERVEAGRLYARVDGRRDAVEIDASSYKAFDHGYATTIHKTQGATVDRAYVLASATMDRHMTYVAMTRHRDAASLYGAKDDFADIDALKTRLGRSGAKETVLDYVDRDGRRRDTGDYVRSSAAGAFARRRGIEREDEGVRWGEETWRSNLAPRTRDVEWDRASRPTKPLTRG